MSDNKLILTADDYGACEFINNGVDIALRKGQINSVATFVTFGKFSEDSVKHLKELQDEIENPFKIGLHFSITSGNPVIKEPSSLANFNQGNSKYWFRTADNYRFKKVDDKDLRNELEAQIETMAEWLGGTDKIDSVSNHHGVVYIDEHLFDIYAEVVGKYKIPIRSPMSWLKSVVNEEKIVLAPVVLEGLHLGFWKKLGDLTKKKLVQRQTLANSNGLKMSYCLTDVIYGRPSVELLNDLFALNEGWKLTTEFMFHLGDPEMNPDLIIAPHGINHKYFKHRINELQILEDINLEEKLKQYNIQKITFADLIESDFQEAQRKG